MVVSGFRDFTGRVSHRVSAYEQQSANLQKLLLGAYGLAQMREGQLLVVNCLVVGGALSGQTSLGVGDLDHGRFTGAVAGH